MDTQPGFDFFAELCRTLVNLAASAHHQADYLRTLRLHVDAGVDELALEYDDARHAPQPEIVEKAKCFVELDAALDQMSLPEFHHLWTDEALHTSSEWARVRELAGRCLTELQSAK